MRGPVFGGPYMRDPVFGIRSKFPWFWEQPFVFKAVYGSFQKFRGPQHRRQAVVLSRALIIIALTKN